MTTKSTLISRLNDLGIKVVAGKVRKSDIKEVLAIKLIKKSGK
jgi:hypothetical protein